MESGVRSKTEDGDIFDLQKVRLVAERVKGMDNVQLLTDK